MPPSSKLVTLSYDYFIYYISYHTVIKVKVFLLENVQKLGKNMHIDQEAGFFLHKALLLILSFIAVNFLFSFISFSHRM